MPTLQTELNNEFTGKAVTIEPSADNKEWIIKVDEVEVNVVAGKQIQQIMTVANAKKEGTVFDDNTTIIDDYKNEITVPKGFKISSDSATNVTGGVVIEDATYTNTIGSQFVWIPIGVEEKSIKKNVEGTETVNINLDRYTFQDDTSTKTGLKVSLSQKFTNASGYHSYLKNNWSEETTYREGSTAENKNATSKELNVFISSAKSKGGYYIGRYEARTSALRTASNNVLTKITVTPDNYVYNFVTQVQASKLSREMYTKDNNNNNITQFSTDLINSYAWDTTCTFLQEFGDANYPIKSSTNSSLANQGTNKSDNGEKDIMCNIWDIASNCMEWTTETWLANTTYCEGRGGIPGNCASFRGSGFVTGKTDDKLISFRPILYIK